MQLGLPHVQDFPEPSQICHLSCKNEIHQGTQKPKEGFYGRIIAATEMKDGDEEEEEVGHTRAAAPDPGGGGDELGDAVNRGIGLVWQGCSGCTLDIWGEARETSRDFYCPLCMCS